MAQFFLRQSTATKSNIWIRLRTDGKDIRLPLHRTIAPSSWDSSKQRPRNGKDSQLRDDIRTLDKRVDEFIENCKRNGNTDYDAGDIRALVDQVFSRAIVKTPKGEKVPSGILAFCDFYIEKTTSGEMLLSKKAAKAAPLTIRGWGTFRGILERFLAKYQKDYGKPLKWGAINAEVGEEFVNWMASEGYTASTINKQLSRFRSLGNLARTRYKLHNNDGISDALKNTEANKLKHAYLTESELAALYGMELNATQAKYRDIFLVECLSGQRISDVASISKDDISTRPDGTKVWTIRQQKTDEEVEIALVGVLGEIFTKYHFSMPKICPQVLNRAIKAILEKLAEEMPTLKESIKVTNKKAIGKTSESEKEDEIAIPRWKAISNHSGRRTLITNALDSGRYTRQQVMAMSGHKSLASFELYVSKSRSDVAKETADIQVKAAAEAAKAGRPFFF